MLDFFPLRYLSFFICDFYDFYRLISKKLKSTFFMEMILNTNSEINSKKKNAYKFDF